MELLQENEGSEHWARKIDIAVKYPCSRARLDAEIKRTADCLSYAMINHEVNLALNLIYTKGVDLERVIKSSNKEYGEEKLRPIHIACREGMYIVFKELIKIGVSTKCERGSLLHYAVEGGDYEIVI